MRLSLSGLIHGEALPKCPTPLSFYLPFLTSYPLYIPSIDKWYPFHTPSVIRTFHPF